MCDATCGDSFDPSYATMVSDCPGCIANRSEYQKTGKYSSIEDTHLFVSVGMETTRIFGSEADYIFYELGVCLKTSCLDFLLQRIAVVIQCGIAAAVLGSSAVNNDI